MSPELKQIFKPSPILTPIQRNFCPGCTHGIIHRLVADRKSVV